MTTTFNGSRVRVADSHPCPGGCGVPVPYRQFACPSCWYRLPYGLRQPITQNYRRDFASHAAAMREGRRWFQDNPLPERKP